MEVDGDYPNPGDDIHIFKARAKMAMEFQVNSRNFKASKKIDVMKVYLFYLLRVYLVDDLSNEAIVKRRSLVLWLGHVQLQEWSA